MKKSLSSAVILALMLAFTAMAQASSISLPALGADESGTSVSALSSGALMAVQYQVAYSNSVIGAGAGAGVVAGIGPPSRLQSNDTRSLHVAFHCCKQSAVIVQGDSYTKTSHNNLADSKKIIMLYS